MSYNNETKHSVLQTIILTMFNEPGSRIQEFPGNGRQSFVVEENFRYRGQTPILGMVPGDFDLVAPYVEETRREGKHIYYRLSKDGEGMAIWIAGLDLHRENNQRRFNVIDYVARDEVNMGAVFLQSNSGNYYLKSSPYNFYHWSQEISDDVFRGLVEDQMIVRFYDLSRYRVDVPIYKLSKSGYIWYQTRCGRRFEDYKETFLRHYNMEEGISLYGEPGYQEKGEA